MPFAIIEAMGDFDRLVRPPGMEEAFAHGQNGRRKGEEGNAHVPGEGVIPDMEEAFGQREAADQSRIGQGERMDGRHGAWQGDGSASLSRNRVNIGFRSVVDNVVLAKEGRRSFRDPQGSDFVPRSGRVPPRSEDRIA